MHYMDIVSQPERAIPKNIFMFNFSNRNTREWGELYSELTIKTLERRRFRMFLLLNLNKQMFAQMLQKVYSMTAGLFKKMLCIKCCPCPPNFYSQNVLMYKCR